jgi:hypothetical protein
MFCTWNPNIAKGRKNVLRTSDVREPRCGHPLNEGMTGEWVVV